MSECFWIMKWERVWEEAIVKYFIVAVHNLVEGNEGFHEKIQLR
jgi:hypothetical protein